MHKSGIFLRDIKPENILLKGDNVKLIDFGCYVWGKPENQNSTGSCGRLTYMPPERVKNVAFRLPVYSFDIYSVGVILNEFDSQQKPYSTREEGAWDLTRQNPALANV